MARLAVLASFSGTGGVERMLVNLLTGFAALGVAVDLLTIRADSPYLQDLPNQNLRVVPLGARHALTALPALIRYLRRERPPVLLVAKDRAGRMAVLARALSGVPVRLVLRLGTHLTASLKNQPAWRRGLRRLPIRLLYPHLDGIVAVSQGVAEDIATLARLPRDRIQVIPNPVITSALLARAQEPPSHPWAAPGEPPLILAAGRLTVQKDFPTLVRAFARLPSTLPCRLMILGKGNPAPLMDLARQLGVAERLVIPGFMANPHALMARAALFVLSSRWEGSPNVLTEALALGIPAVSTDCPSGPREILGPLAGFYADPGPLVPVGDVEAMARAMAATLTNPPPATTLRQAAVPYHQTLSVQRYLVALGLLIPETHPDAVIEPL